MKIINAFMRPAVAAALAVAASSAVAARVDFFEPPTEGGLVTAQADNTWASFVCDNLMPRQSPSNAEVLTSPAKQEISTALRA